MEGLIRSPKYHTPTPGTLLLTISFSFLHFITVCIFLPLDAKLYKGRDFILFITMSTLSSIVPGVYGINNYLWIEWIQAA